jgi:predicted lipoprotein with Yx(FWY)xxD motif
MKIASTLIAAALLAAGVPAFAAKSCDELKTEIAAKLDAKSVTGYTLEVVEADKAGDAKVVGSCEGGAKKITYAKK